MTAAFTIKHHQQEAVEKILEHWEREPAVCVQLPIGTGKAVVVTELLKRLPDSRVLILVDNQPRAIQLYQNFNSEFAFPIGLIDHTKEINWRSQQSVISTLQTIGRDFKELSEHFDVLITYDLAPTKQNEIALQQSFETHKKVINIVSFFSKKQAAYLGKLVYQYPHPQAIRDGVLKPVDYIAGPLLNVRGNLNRPWTISALENFAKHFEHQNNHALIICRNMSEAQLVKEVCNEMLASVEVVVLHSKMPNATLKIREFVNQENKSIAIVVDMFTGLDIAKLTDVVLFRKFGSQHAFLQAIGLLRHGGRIWDFGGNRKYFENGMGSVSEDNRILDNSTNSDGEDANTVNHNSGSKSSQKETTSRQSEEKIVDDKNNNSIASVLQKLANPCDDKPTQQDLLGRDGLVNILKGVIDRDARKHLIIALFGRWGSGKSSVINLLKEKYKNSKNSSFIIFNAWQEEHSASMAASLANKISDDLYQTKSFFEQLGLTIKYRLVDSKWSLGFECLLAISAAIFAFLSLIPDTTNPGFPSYFTGIALLIIPVAKSYWSHPFTSKVRDLAKKSDFSSHLGINHQIREQLSNLLRIYPLGYWRSLLTSRWYPIPEQHKYIVVIDDLDRCSDVKIVETLEAMQLIVDIEGICVILAVDHQMLLDAVANRYKKQRPELSKHESQALARDFLGKILQLTISLDRPTDAKKKEFIHSRLYSAVKLNPIEPSAPEIMLDDKEQEFFTELTDPFNVEFFSDDMIEEFEVSTDYLSSTYEEYAFFKQCSDVFDVHNPRTLVRIHNSITLLKGLYPSVSDDSKTLKHYIYMVFWFEQYSAATSRQQSEMKTALFAENKPSSAIWELLKQINISTEKTKELRRILYRVKNLSLPSGSDLENDELSRHAAQINS